jgi:hypothetical protein
MKTSRLARELGVNYYRLLYLVNTGKIPPPRKDDSGDFVWGRGDIARAKEALGKVLRRGPVPREAAHA